MNYDIHLRQIKQGIPPSCAMKENRYQVMICSNSHANWDKAWTPVGNSWGFPYSIKGFAINCAKQWLSHLARTSPSLVYVRVVNLSTGVDVWRSENVITAWGEVDNA